MSMRSYIFCAQAICIAICLPDVTAAGDVYACSLEGLQSRLSSFADFLVDFFNEFGDQTKIAAELVERTDKNILPAGAGTRQWQDMIRFCKPAGKPLCTTIASCAAGWTQADCDAEDAFWRDLDSKTPEQVANHSRYGYWVDVAVDRPEDIWWNAWANHYAFDYEKVEQAAKKGTPSYAFAKPARNGYLKRKPLSNLTQLCVEQDLSSCLTNLTNVHCPAWCRTPDLFNNSWSVYELFVTAALTEFYQVLGKKYQGKAFAWYYCGVDTMFARYWPSLAALNAHSGIFLGGDFGFPKLHLQGPLFNPDKGVAWSPPYYDAGSSNLMVTASAPVYVAGLWIGGVNVDITLFQLAPMLDKFTGTAKGFSILCDMDGTIVGAAASTFSTLFCPGDSNCNAQGQFDIAKSWDQAMSHVQGEIGPRLKGSNFDAFKEDSQLWKAILSQESGVLTATLGSLGGFYVAWASLENKRIIGGLKIIVCVPLYDVDSAAVVEVQPNIMNLLDEEKTAKITITNKGFLSYTWQTTVIDGDVTVMPSNGTLGQNGKVELTLQRNTPHRAQLVLSSAPGNYSSCFEPISVYIERKDPSPSEEILVTVLVSILSVVGGGLVLAFVVWGGLWVWKQHQAKLRLQKEAKETRERVLHERVLSSYSNLAQMGFAMVVVDATEFLKYGQLTSFENMILAYAHRFLSDLQDVSDFCAENMILFISHQWLGLKFPDKNGDHYNAICRSIIDICNRKEVDMSKLWVWVDYTCIPQRNRTMKFAAINSLPIYASVSTFFVIVTPEAMHADLQKLCNAATYQKRGWCRLEQMCRFMKSGVDNMYIFTDHLKELTEDRDWYSESVRVFDGEFTDPNDKNYLVDILISLWCHVYRNYENGVNSLSYQVISADKDAIFPKQYFGELVEYAEEHFTTIIQDNEEMKTAADSFNAIKSLREEHADESPRGRVFMLI